MNWPFLTIISQIARCSFFVPFTTTILSGVQILFHLSTHAKTFALANLGVLAMSRLLLAVAGHTPGEKLADIIRFFRAFRKAKNGLTSS